MTRSRKRDVERHLAGWVVDGQLSLDLGDDMASPGPTETMLARQVRMGDVLYVDDVPHAVTRVTWLDSVGGQPLHIAFTVEGGGTVDAMADDPLDVTRPFTRHDTTGEHDT